MTDNELTGTLQSRGQEEGANYAVINNERFSVPDYVLPFLSRVKDGEEIKFLTMQDQKGMRLTKIMRKNRNPKPAAVEPAKVPPPQLHHVRVIKVNEVAIKYDNLSKDPRLAGVRTISLTPAQFGEFTNRGIKDGDEIDIVVDAQGYCSLPDAKFTAARDILRENINKLEEEANAKGNPPTATTTPVKTATMATQGKPSEGSGNHTEEPGKEEMEKPDTARPTPSPLPAPEFATLSIIHTVNLGNYESLKIGIEGQAVDREELEQFLDDTLSRYGRNHPATMEAIDTYRRRVLGVKI